MNIVVIMQARSGSTRLPGKIMKKILGKSILQLQMERMLNAKTPSKIVVATTKNKIDDDIVNICKSNNYEYFRGDENNLLDRHYQAAKKYNAEVVVKIPSDCPLIDPKIIDRVISYYIDNQGKFDFVSNLHPATYPDGNDVELMPMKMLELAWKEAEKDYELEHTTPYFWEQPERFRIGNVEWESGLDYSMSHRFTIDYPEDYDFIKRVFEELYPHNPTFSLDDIIYLLEQKPEIMDINRKYSGVNWYRNHLGELKTIGANQTKQIDN